MSKITESLATLQKRVSRSRYFAAGVILLVCAAYIIRFVGGNGIHWSSEPSHWGVFGDYVGGLLNPTLAYLAFYWLTQSILLQKEELAETREALERSAESQEKLEQNARITSKLTALNTMLQSKNSDISNLRANIQFITQQIYSQSHIILHDGSTVTTEKALQNVQELTDALKLHLKQREEQIDKLNAALGPDA